MGLAGAGQKMREDEVKQKVKRAEGGARGGSIKKSTSRSSQPPCHMLKRGPWWQIVVPLLGRMPAYLQGLGMAQRSPYMFNCVFPIMKTYPFWKGVELTLRCS